LEVTKGIHLIPGVRGANAYLVIGREGLIVVDTGLPGSAGKITDYIRSVGSDPSQVKYIVLTHPDIDHSGNVAKLKEITNAKVMIHEADAPRLSGEKETKKVKGAFGLLLKVTDSLMKFTPIKPDVLLKDLDKIDELTVIHTPGHTEGSICLYIAGKVLFVGDALRTNNNKKPELPPKSVTLDMNMAKSSLAKISELEYPVLLPGHGPPLDQDASAIVKEFVAKSFE